MIHLPDGVFRIRFDGPPAAPVLILSHPLGTDLDVWQPQIAALSHSFRVLRYDMRGHGASEVSPPGYGMERLGADVLALLDALGIARAHFCGQSMSGMIGQWLGINTPERLGKLILANTAAKIGGADLWNGRIASVETGGMGAVTGAVLERWFTPAILASASGEPERIAAILRAAPPLGHMASCLALRDADFRQPASRITVPTLVLAGTDDMATPAADGRALAGSIRGAAYMELAAPHLSNLESPDQFNRAVLDFLSA